MNVKEKKRKCKKHKPTFEKENGGAIIYVCARCGWRGQFTVSSTANTR